MKQVSHSDSARLVSLKMQDVVNNFMINKQPQFIPTGIPELDESLTGGLPVGQLTVVLGYTGAGKSELGRQIRARCAEDGVPVIHVDVELGYPRILIRDVAQKSHVEPAVIRTKDKWGEQAPAIRDALGDISEWPVTCIDGATGAPIEELEEEVITAARDMRTDTATPLLLILDSAQRLASACDGDAQRLQVQHWLWWASKLARNHNFAAVVTAEQKRTMEGGTPRIDEVLTSGAESRAIEYVADVVLGLVPKREDQKRRVQPGQSFSRQVRLVIAKNREGQTGVLDSILEFRGPYWEMNVVSESDSWPQYQAILKDGEVHSVDEIHKAIGRRKQTVSNELKEHASEGRIRRVGNGGPGSGYQLVPPETLVPDSNSVH